MSLNRVSYQPIDDLENFSKISTVNCEVERGAPSKLKNYRRIFVIVGVVTIFLSLALLFINFSSNASISVADEGSTPAEFDASGRYVMRNFDEAKPMASFLAGLGGFWGIPMWCFYVNRGQGVTSFGIQNKDGGISKFDTANIAYQATPFTGFRTFVKGFRMGSEKFSHMPFFPNSVTCQTNKPSRDMIIGMNEMEIREVSQELKLQTNILYFTVVDEEFPALVRQTTFTNLDTTSSLVLDVLDGLANLIPAGLSNGNLDAMGRTMEGWMNVYNVPLNLEDGITLPYYHISQGTADSAKVQVISEGHFAISFVEETQGQQQLLPFVVDPTVVFGTDTTLSYPDNFFGSANYSSHAIARLPQGTSSRTPCAFAAATLVIPAQASKTITTIFGHADSLETFVEKYSSKLRTLGFADGKRNTADKLVHRIADTVTTSTSSDIFDAYVKQSYLDNVLRGGLPLLFGNSAAGNKSPAKVFHTFSRIHGDIERDYNFFQLDLTFFSQGPGNFRDVSQNRRMDVVLNPAVGSFNVHMFLSLVQADGYNPLTVASTNFKVNPAKLQPLIAFLLLMDSKDIHLMTVLTDLLSRPFRPGQLFHDLKAANISHISNKAEFLNKVIDASDQTTAAKYDQNGYWADHWTYTLDHVDSYLSVFPDREEALLWGDDADNVLQKSIPFYMSPAIVRPRVSRFSLVEDRMRPGQSTIRVYNAVSTWDSPDFPGERKAALMNIYQDSAYVSDSTFAGGVWQRDKTGKTFSVTAMAKLVMLGVIKFSTLDPSGMGVEMEGGKPGWNDAMNGLPGMMGSGMPETYEMLRILKYSKSAISRHGRTVDFPVEFSDFLNSIADELNNYLDDAMKDFEFWDAMNTLRETYRSRILATFDGAVVQHSAATLVEFIGDIEAKVTLGISRALSYSTPGLSPTYFFHQCTEFEFVPPPVPATVPPAPTQVIAKAFAVQTLPLFLEGPARHLKIIMGTRDIEDKRQVYQATKESTLYDKKLSMFTISESMKGVNQEVGRMMAFSAGWLENQSVWLHMSYKFYLELLRGGLYDEFYQEIKTGLVPFMDTAVYGRSPLEASSFIVSSAFSDAKLHGAGFLARLSGSTAEFMSMWAIMMAGAAPFQVDENGMLSLVLKPVLPGWLFKEDGTVSFTFLGSTKVTYHNSAKIDTWRSAVSSIKLTVAGSVFTVPGNTLSAELAAKVRSGEVETIDATF